MWCTCGKTQGYVVVTPTFCVCNNCQLPTRTVFRKLTNMRVPTGAKAPLSARSEADGQQLIRWAMEDGTVVVTVDLAPYPRKVDMPTPNDSILYTLWQQLDAKVDIIMGPAVDHESQDYAKYTARGMAEAIATIMHGFMEDADAVVRAAVKRHKARNGGEPYVTPGLAEHIWDPTKNWDGSDKVSLGNGTRTEAPARTRKLGKQLSDTEKDTVKQALQMQIPAADLAKTFGVTVEQIEGLK